MPGSKSAAWLDGRMEAPPGAVMPSIYLERREPARNIQRFYAIIITPTLFGAWAMVREWGRIGQPGTVRERSDLRRKVRPVRCSSCGASGR